MAVLRSPYVKYSMCEDVHMQLARNREHYLGAFKLVHDSYCRAGLCQQNELGLRVTPYQLLDSSQVFVATLQGEVICTLTLVRDSELGLPIEEIYSEEIDSRRQRGAQVAEVTCLADRRLSPKRFFQLFSELSRVMAQFARLNGVDEIWIACHPKHAKLYERRLAFARTGERRDYPSVMGNPAVALCLNLQTADQTHPAAWKQYFGESIPEAVLTPTPLHHADAAFFAEISACCVRTDAYLAEPPTPLVA